MTRPTPVPGKPPLNRRRIVVQMFGFIGRRGTAIITIILMLLGGLYIFGGIVGLTSSNEYLLAAIFQFVWGLIFVTIGILNLVIRHLKMLLVNGILLIVTGLFHGLFPVSTPLLPLPLFLLIAGIYFVRQYSNAVKSTQITEQKGAKPSLSLPRIIAEILVSGVTGFVGVLIAIMPTGLAAMAQAPSPTARIWGIIVGSVIATLGSSLCVYGVGNIGRETGSFLATLTISILVGGLAYGTLAFLSFSSSSHGFPGAIRMVVALVAMIGPSIGATIGFNRTRRYKSPPTSETSAN
ncbi:hypothetical protein IH992_19625 [Candidatus Poribacteria bacterium]|nr:hypothetical protein [Candidatus Poribacteria bacterium]